jgi:anthranilate synthase component 1
MRITPNCSTVPLDLTTPAAIYLRLRDRYSRVFLFESSDYHGPGDCRSFICCDPIAECVVDDGICTIRHGATEIETFSVEAATGLAKALSAFMQGIKIGRVNGELPKGVTSGVFGHIAWSAIPYLEQIKFQSESPEGFKVPDAHLSLFRYVIACNPFKGEAYVLEHQIEGAGVNSGEKEEFMRVAFSGSAQTYPFRREGEELSIQTDTEFLDLIAKCKQHIARGDVFQIVPSRRYLQRYSGDDFQLYRSLRSINPSPYLFYCDYGAYRLIGSSPEAQISIADGVAGIFPIAGTYRRTGDDETDLKEAKKLLEDPKENAEHSMLVDLARNDLSRYASEVRVAAYRETHFYSHLIHLVSKVVGKLPDRSFETALRVICDTFPVGTLSGAPKHSAMTILDRNEPHGRGHYGGCIGFIGFNGDVVLGIMIRSFLSIGQTLAYQAGMGIVFDSNPESELAEAHTKLRALRLAIVKAEQALGERQ